MQDKRGLAGAEKECKLVRARGFLLGLWIVIVSIGASPAEQAAASRR